MKKWSFLILFLAACSSVFSQAQVVADTLALNGNIQILGHVNLGFTGRGMPVGFFGKFWKGGSLEKDYLTRTRNKMGDEVVFGGGGSQRLRISYDKDSFLLKKTGLAIALDVERGWNLSTFFPRDLFSLVFFGNQDNADLRFGPSWFRQFSYLKAGLNAAWSFRSKWGRHVLQGGAYQILGRDFIQIDVERGALQTAKYGTRIDLNLQVRYLQSDTANRKASFVSPNGRGGCFSFQHLFSTPKNSTLIGFSNLGYINWNSGTLDQAADTSVQLSGYRINTLRDLSDSLFQLSLDSLERISPSYSKGRYRMTLPAHFFFESLQSLPGIKGQLISGVQYVLDPASRPLFYAGYNMPFKRSGLRATIGYGGYSKLNLSAHYRYSFLKRWTFFAGFNQAEFLVQGLNPKGILAMAGIRMN